MRTRVIHQGDESPDGRGKFERVLMRWAVRAESYAVVHISQLDRDETGLKCGCVCSECDARLQAVNAGRPPKAFRRPGSLDQFFRHDSAQQHADCLFAAARLAALKLIVESGQLDLPPATVTHDHRAPSGHVYTATATGKALSTRVVNYHWIDRRSATLTLPDGKKILVHLQATSLTAADGQWDAELTIRINDPEVASWSPDEILEQIRLNPDFTCWERHWQHAELQQQALDDAVGIAARQGDAYPEGLDAYSGEGRHGVRRRGRAERCFRSIYLWITKFGSAISHAETAWTLGSCPEQAPVRITTHPPDDYYSPAACPVPAK